MKLNKENFIKEIDGSIVRYMYSCNDTNFYLELIGQNLNRNIKVFKGSLSDRQEELTTKDSLEAWNYFEELLKACNPEQGSSGGGNLGKNPEQNPNIMPLLAIGDLESDNFRKITLFVVKDDGEQVKIFDFRVEGNTMPKQLPNEVFSVDWSNQDISQIVKCEVILKEFDVTFNEEPNKKVFLFIPKSMADQGGEKGGNTQEGGDEDSPIDDDGKPKKDKGDKERKNKYQKEKPSDEEEDDEKEKPKGIEDGPDNDDVEPKKDKGDKERKNKDQKEKPSDEKGDDENGEPTNEKLDDDEDVKPTDKTTPFKSNKTYNELVVDIAKTTNGNFQPNELLSIFRSQKTTESWLSTNNFTKIKQDLNLPKTMTPKELTKLIINSK